MRQEVYGYFPGGDPRLFTPDEQACTRDELARWRDDCAAWERGEKVERRVSGCEERVLAPGTYTFGGVAQTITEPFRYTVHVTRSVYGYGTWIADTDDEAPEPSPVDMLTWAREDVLLAFCQCPCLFTFDTRPESHDRDCPYVERLREVEHLRGGPLT